MRVKLGYSRRFFDEILQNQSLSLKQFSKLIKVNYSNLKKYRRGDLCIPKSIFDAVLSFSSKRHYWVKTSILLEDNWGPSKGGTKSSMNDKNNLRVAYARKFRKIKKVKIRLNNFFCEFYGLLLGDGCISRFRDWEGTERFVIFITCNKRLDHEYLKYIQQRLNKEYQIYSYYYEYKNKNVCQLSIKNKGLCLELNEKFDVPIGLKYDKLKLSEEILSLPWNVKKYVLRGLFDTDGCILANKRENYRYPWVTISSKSRSFREEIKGMLKKEGYPAYITGSDVCVRGIANVKRWFKDIGSSNSRNLLKYEYFLKHGYLPARLLDGLIG